jgi:hypothetical protein
MKNHKANFFYKKKYLKIHNIYYIYISIIELRILKYLIKIKNRKRCNTFLHPHHKILIFLFYAFENIEIKKHKAILSNSSSSTTKKIIQLLQEWGSELNYMRLLTAESSCYILSIITLFDFYFFLLIFCEC